MGIPTLRVVATAPHCGVMFLLEQDAKDNGQKVDGSFCCRRFVARAALHANVLKVIRKEVDRIIRVDHAGEHGAIKIYSAQILISRILHKDIVPALENILSHEREHFRRFDQLLKNRQVRHCYALGLWAVGGFMLGLFTALLGRNAIWVCTNSIETTVLHHLDWQLAFLKEHDQDAYDAVLSIKADEEEHREFGQINGTDSIMYRPIFWVVRKSTESAIWLSTKL